MSDTIVIVAVPVDHADARNRTYWIAYASDTKRCVVVTDVCVLGLLPCVLLESTIWYAKNVVPSMDASIWMVPVNELDTCAEMTPGAKNRVACVTDPPFVVIVPTVLLL